MRSITSASKMHKCRGKYAVRSKSGRIKGTDLVKLTAEWEARLKRCHLGMDSGHDRTVITYGHMVADLDWDGKVTYEPPTGERLDSDEWPVSLL